MTLLQHYTYSCKQLKGLRRSSLHVLPSAQQTAAMAPKKKEEVKEKPILGRFRNNLKARFC